jgi:alpha-galactosidase/6-phospho-beta-glucosidase family protein
MKESVKKFAEEMARRLNEHDADLEVAGLNHYSLAYFMSKLIDETKELEEYVGSGDLNGGRKVAVDVANSSRAIFDICTKLLDGNGE